jgi:RNA polymerase-binding transcription factor DksA
MRTTNDFSRPQLRQIERELQLERTRVERAIARDVRPADVGDTSDDQPAFHAQAITAADEARLRREALDAALQRVAAGEYGHCVVCGEQIAFERLLAMPDVARCVGCAARG